MIATVTKWILYIGPTFAGPCHDYTMLKAEFSPELPWFEAIRVLLDSGYQGIRSDFVGARIEIPCKKPRKSKKNPAPSFLMSKRQKIRN